MSDDAVRYYISLVEAINAAKTEREHRALDRERRAWLMGWSHDSPDPSMARGYMLMCADMHYIDQGVDSDVWWGIPGLGGVMVDGYTRGLVALHNLHIVLDEAKSLPDGSPGFPSGVRPLDHVNNELDRLMNDLCESVLAAKLAAHRGRK